MPGLGPISAVGISCMSLDPGPIRLEVWPVVSMLPAGRRTERVSWAAGPVRHGSASLQRAMQSLRRSAALPAAWYGRPQCNRAGPGRKRCIRWRFSRKRPHIQVSFLPFLRPLSRLQAGLTVDTTQCTLVDVIREMARDGHRARLFGVAELTVIALRPFQKPSVCRHESNDVPDLHSFCPRCPTIVSADDSGHDIVRQVHPSISLSCKRQGNHARLSRLVSAIRADKGHYR